MVRALSSNHRLPDNPRWIEFTRTDGVEARRPTSTEFNPDSDNNVNYMRPVPLTEGFSIGWRLAFGKALASKLGYEESQDWVLRDWPQDYGLFDHNKGPVEKPRHDPYLIGSKHVGKFRSVPEFIPHAYWLLTDETLDRGNCECKYCAGMPQRVITERLGLASTRSSSMAPSQISAFDHSQSISAPPPRGTASRPYRVPPTRGGQPATQRQAPNKKSKSYMQIEIKSVLPAPDPTRVSVENDRERDVRAASSSDTARLPRWFRKDEVVWCKLPFGPLHGLIEYWPALVLGSKPTSSFDLQQASTSKAAQLPTRQHTKYRIEFLGCTCPTTYVRDTEILPYQMQSPNPDMWPAVANHIAALNTIDFENMPSFNPNIASTQMLAPQAPTERAQESAETFARAAVPFALAVEMAACIARHWTPTHEFSNVYHNGGANKDKGKERPTRVPKEAGLTNQYRDEQGRLVVPEPRPSGTVSRDEFEALMWGPERIWTHDLVRLRPLRKEFFPNHPNEILHASGLSARQQEKLQQLFPHTVGDAGERGVFMHVKSFRSSTHPSDAPDAPRTLLVSGTPYELAYADCKELEDLSQYPSDPPLKPESPSTPEYTKMRLPCPPPGFAWRPIIVAGYEVIVDITAIAGRYYGRLHEHPLLEEPGEAGHFQFLAHQASMYGLTAGWMNSIKAEKHVKQRSQLMKIAAEEARDVVKGRLSQGKEESVKPEDLLEDIPFNEDVEMG